MTPGAQVLVIKNGPHLHVSGTVQSTNAGYVQVLLESGMGINVRAKELALLDSSGEAPSSCAPLAAASSCAPLAAARAHLAAADVLAAPLADSPSQPPLQQHEVQEVMAVEWAPLAPAQPQPPLAPPEAQELPPPQAPPAVSATSTVHPASLQDVAPVTQLPTAEAEEVLDATAVTQEVMDVTQVECVVVAAAADGGAEEAEVLLADDGSQLESFEAMAATRAVSRARLERGICRLRPFTETAPRTRHLSASSVDRPCSLGRVELSL